jgi:hypothetical protein
MLLKEKHDVYSKIIQTTSQKRVRKMQISNISLAMYIYFNFNGRNKLFRVYKDCMD